MIGKNIRSMVAEGSPVYRHVCGAISSTAFEWVSVSTTFPRAKLFEPLDNIEVINNSADEVVLYLDAISGEQFSIPAYMIKTIPRKAFRRFGIYDAGTTGIGAGEVIVSMKRLPPDVQPTVNVG